MSFNQSNLRITNEQVLLMNILNTMYNDNLRQINSVTEMLNNLNESNNQIRGLLVQLLGTQNSHNSASSNFRRNRRDLASNINSNRINNLNLNGETFGVGGQSYIIDNITEYTIPLRTTGNYLFEYNRNNRNNRNRSGDNNGVFSQLLQSFLNPVEIYPTQSQIEAATRYVRYSDIARPINTQCPISMEDFNDSDMVTVIRPCGHIFNTNSLQSWFRANCRCPVCRYDIRDYNSNASTEFFNTQNQNQQEQQTSNSNLERTNSISNNVPETTFNNNNNNNNNILDVSGNPVNISSDLLASYLLNAFIRH